VVIKTHLLILINAALEQRRKFAPEANSYLMGYVTSSTERAAKRYKAITDAIQAARDEIKRLDVK
jgi:hypothetical protein